MRTTSLKSSRFSIVLIVLFLFSNFVKSDGFTVSSISTSSVVTKDTDPATVYWIINTQFNGGGQSLTGTVSPDTVKGFMGSKLYTKQPLSITAQSANEQVFYDVINQGVPVYKYAVQTYNGVQTCLGICVYTADAPSCPSGTTFDVPLGISSLFHHVIKRYCVTKTQVGVKGVYDNPTVGFNAKITLSVGNTVSEKTICSGAVSNCDGSSVNFDQLGVATWTGSLVTGESAPNQNNFVAINKLDANSWHIVKSSTFDSYSSFPPIADNTIQQFLTLFPNYQDIARGDAEINNAINPTNTAADTLLAEDTSFTSSQFSKDANTGKVTVTLQRSLTSPNVVFRIRADYLGIVIPSGQPKITGVTAPTLKSGEDGTVSVQVQNIGDGAGTFSAMLVNCDPFIESTSAQTSRKTLQPGDVDSIAILVNGGSNADGLSKACSVKVYDVNDPSKEADSTLTLTLEKPKVCEPGKITAEGNIIKKCSQDGTSDDTIQTCDSGVTTDRNGNWICAPSLSEQTQTQQNNSGSCSSDNDCPKYAACNLDSKQCFECTDLHCCQPGKIWSNQLQTCSNPMDSVGFPKDTSCQTGWPGKQGNKVSIGEINYACDLFEVKDPDLLSIPKEAAQCYASKCADSSCHSLCDLAYQQSGSLTSLDSYSFKRFAALYIIYGLGPAAKFMNGYFSAEIKCGTNGAGGCEPRQGFNNNVQQLECKPPVGQPRGWASDTDMSKNTCAFSDLPAHASLNILHTGTCVDYSVALTSLLRLVGYGKDEVYSVTACGHEYNLVKFPGDSMWSIVDTVGNAATPLGDTWSWECGGKTTNHCDYYPSTCANDGGQISCPSKSEVIGC